VSTAGDFQKRATEEGRLAQDLARRVLLGAEFKVLERNKKLKDLGVTINFICTDATDREWYFDVSGAVQSNRAGLVRTDTMWKTLGRANVLAGSGVERLVLLTTNLPKPKSVGDTALRCAKGTFLDAVEMLSTEGKARLHKYATAGDNLVRLPGFWRPEDIYGDQLQLGGVAGADLSVPLDLTGDPLGSLHGYSVNGMSHRLKVYLPSQTKDGSAIAGPTRKRCATNIKTILSNLGGGCTSQEGKGSWVHPFSGVVDEDVDLIETYSSARVPDEVLRQIVELILIELDQEAAALVVDARMLHYAR
jgi:hypothetical protein